MEEQEGVISLVPDCIDTESVAYFFVVITMVRHQTIEVARGTSVMIPMQQLDTLQEALIMPLVYTTHAIENSLSPILITPE